MYYYYLVDLNKCKTQQTIEQQSDRRLHQQIFQLGKKYIEQTQANKYLSIHCKDLMYKGFQNIWGVVLTETHILQKLEFVWAWLQSLPPTLSVGPEIPTSPDSVTRRPAMCLARASLGGSHIKYMYNWRKCVPLRIQIDLRLLFPLVFQEICQPTFSFLMFLRLQCITFWCSLYTGVQLFSVVIITFASLTYLKRGF